MHDFLHHRRHRFDALFALLTGRGTAPLPRNAPLLRGVGLSERIPTIQLSRITRAALAHRANR